MTSAQTDSRVALSQSSRGPAGVCATAKAAEGQIATRYSAPSLPLQLKSRLCAKWRTRLNLSERKWLSIVSKGLVVLLLAFSSVPGVAA